MNTDHSALSNMITALLDARPISQHACTKVARAHLKRLFERMRKNKTAIVHDMQNTVVLRGAEPSDELSFAGTLRKADPGALARLSPDTEATYVAELGA